MKLNLEQHTNEELIIKARHGDEPSLELFVKRNLSLVYSIARQYFKNNDEAEDAAQEAFIKVWKNLKKFDKKRKVKPWLSEITKNTCLDILKQRRAIPFSSFENEAGVNMLVETLVSNQKSPVELVDLSIAKHALKAAITKLSGQSRQVLALYYEEGLNFREIAEKLRESINTIKSRHRRAIETLRDLTGETY